MSNLWESARALNGFTPDNETMQTEYKNKKLQFNKRQAMITMTQGERQPSNGTGGIKGSQRTYAGEKGKHITTYLSML